jgi:hypothetical protein
MYLCISLRELRENMGNLSKVRDHHIEPETSQTK